VKPVEQRSSRCVGQGLEHVVYFHEEDNRQPIGCMSRGCFVGDKSLC
jgi:hypothetical protein